MKRQKNRQEIARTINSWVNMMLNDSRNKTDKIQMQSAEAVKQATVQRIAIWANTIRTDCTPIVLTIAKMSYTANATARRLYKATDKTELSSPEFIIVF